MCTFINCVCTLSMYTHIHSLTGKINLFQYYETFSAYANKKKEKVAKKNVQKKKTENETETCICMFLLSFFVFHIHT